MHGVGNRDGIEQRGRLHGSVRPLLIQDKQRIGQRRASFENLRALEFLQFDLRGIERHDV